MQVGSPHARDDELVHAGEFARRFDERVPAALSLEEFSADVVDEDEEDYAEFIAQQAMGRELAWDHPDAFSDPRYLAGKAQWREAEPKAHRKALRA
jgi:hypothetical protein